MPPTVPALLAALLAAPPAGVRPFLDAHCVGCHSPANKSGGLDLEALAAGPAAFAAWVKVHDRVAAGEMPPAKKPRPPQADRDAFLRGLSATLTAEQTKRRGADGRTTVRRLNRAEIENTLRDLLALPGLEVRDLLPEDGRAGGYDRSAAALDVSAVLLARYADAVDKALDAATAKYSVPPEVERKTLYANHQYDFMILTSGGDAVMLTKDKKYDDGRFPMPAGDDKVPYPGGKWGFGGKYKGLGEAQQGGAFKEPSTVGLTRCQDEAFAGRFAFAPIHPGRYRVAVSAWSYWWDKGVVKPAPRSGAVGLYAGGRLLGHVDAPSLSPTVGEVTVDLDPKPRDILKVDPASLWNMHVYFTKGQVAGYTGPGVAIDSLTVEGPLYDEWPPPSHRRLFGNLRVAPLAELPADAPRPKRETPPQLSHDALNNAGRLVFGATVSADPSGDARRLLAEFQPRAFRRPVPADEVERYAAVADARRAAGASFEDSQKAAYKAALLGPEFLFLREPAGPLDGYALACRLSYFLWNSTPDDALTAAADKLRDPKVLRAQAERMLADPRAERFVADFLDQWLDLREFDATTPDKRLYPEWSPYLADAIRREPRAYFATLLRENHPAAAVVRSDFAVLNQRLAEHYGVPGVTGTAFRKVGLPASAHRGGLLTQAAVLKVTANGTTTSPVKRGAWVMRKVIGRPPEPPPPDVPAVEPDVRGTTTIREQLAKHRDNAACAACHAKMDPPGFALEGFDVIGGLRDRYRATEGKAAPDFVKLFPSHLSPEGKFERYHVAFRDGPAVDASGKTADGKPFAGIDEFRAILAANPRAVARNLVNQLVAYATGEPVGFADRAAVEGVLDRAGGEYRVRSLVHEVVQSPLFLTK